VTVTWLVSSLSNRIFLTTALLAVLAIGAAVYPINVAVTAQEDRNLQRGVQEAATLVENYSSTLLERFRREARLVADLSNFKASIAESDQRTAQPIAERYQQALGADLFLVTTRTGALLASAGNPGIRADTFASGDAVKQARAAREAISFWTGDRGLLQVVTVPVWIDPGAPEILGTLSVGFALDYRAAERFKELTDSEIAFAYRGAVHAATLPRGDWDAVAALAGRGGVVRPSFGGDEYVGVSRPLLQASSGLPLQSVPSAVVLRSRTEQLRVLRRLHTVLGLTALIAVLAAIGLSYALARTVTRPLGVITKAMRDVAASGDLTRRIPEPPATRWDDEDAMLLASTYNAMTESIARFQREATLRERLSSLGRLSTVIAHEIRNPLMIIKAAMRPLKREQPSASQVQRAVSDVEEEVERLNRIVSEVLDFARPIRFDLAEADVNAVCRDAATAVWVADEGAVLQLHLDPNVGAGTTDAERLRQALVNVLGNARLAAAHGTTPPGVVTLETRRTGDRVCILVRDTGPGIASDALPRVFEPFFTTRRTGTGLGLAITRNIIEGLGGTIHVRSTGPGGTEIVIEIPAPVVVNV
jgi:signal transduction histidine kinase